MAPLDGSPMEMTPQESFYVVPRTASESSPMVTTRAPPPSQITGPSTSIGSKSRSGKNMEELEMENKALRSMVDRLSWKVGVYDKSMYANSQILQTSLATLRTEFDALKVDAPGPSKLEIAQLRDQLSLVTADNQRLRSDIEHYKTDLEKFERRWQKLKDNVKKRRDVSGS